MPWYWNPERCITASRMVLLGMVPVLTQAPPTISRCSITATRRPHLDPWMAARWPGGRGRYEDVVNFPDEGLGGGGPRPSPLKKAPPLRVAPPMGPATVR